MFENWELWQIILTVVFGTVWVVFTVLNIRRKIAAKKRKKEAKERGNNTIFDGNQGQEKAYKSINNH